MDFQCFSFLFRRSAEGKTTTTTKTELSANKHWAQMCEWERYMGCNNIGLSLHRIEIELNKFPVLFGLIRANFHYKTRYIDRYRSLSNTAHLKHHNIGWSIGLIWWSSCILIILAFLLHWGKVEYIVAVICHRLCVDVTWILSWVRNELRQTLWKEVFAMFNQITS